MFTVKYTNRQPKFSRTIECETLNEAWRAVRREWVASEQESAVIFGEEYEHQVRDAVEINAAIDALDENPHATAEEIEARYQDDRANMIAAQAQALGR